jgi:hypothetical protein
MSTQYSQVKSKRSRQQEPVPEPTLWLSPSLLWFLMHIPIFITYEVALLAEWLGTESVDISTNLAGSPQSVQIMLMALSISGWFFIVPVQIKTLWCACFAWTMWIATLVGLFGLQYFTSPNPLHVPFAGVFFTCTCLFFLACSIEFSLWGPAAFVICAAVVLILWVVGAITENWPEYTAASFLLTCWMWQVNKTTALFLSRVKEAKTDTCCCC